MKMWIEMLKELWKRPKLRYASIGTGLVLVLLFLLSGGDSGDEVDSDAYRTEVRRGDLVVSILQSGELEAKNSRDFINEASRDAKIAFIVDDGASVTNGQLLVELESAELKDRFLQQQQSVATAEADLLNSQEQLEIARLKHATDMESARLKVELAEMALNKYKEAEYPQSRDVALSDIALARQELQRARSELEGTQELYDKGYSNRQDLESAQFNVDRREIDVRNKTKELEILEEYTYVKTLKELENALKNAAADLERMEKSFMAEVSRSESRIEAQKTKLEIQKNQMATRERELSNAMMYADFDGQVFYAKERHRAEIELGSSLNYRQKILSYPDLSAWNLRIGVPEAMIDKVTMGQEAVASLDAVPDLLLRGRVSRISAVPDNQGWFNTGVKTYTIIVDVMSEAGGAKLKPGMSATVEIVTDQLRDVLFVPIQSVMSDKDKHYVYIVKRGRKELREVVIGKYNTQYIEIRDGLKEDEELLLYAEIEKETETRFKESPLRKEQDSGGDEKQE
jgi:RND family efflux transporter MFP subunit